MIFECSKMSSIGILLLSEEWKISFQFVEFLAFLVFRHPGGKT